MWVQALAVDEIDPEDLVRWDHGGQTYALYRDAKGAVFATDGLCTHEKVHLCDGLVMDFEIECPKHAGAFDYRTGEAMRLPPCVNLRTYRAELVDGEIRIAIG